MNLWYRAISKVRTLKRDGVLGCSSTRNKRPIQRHLCKAHPGQVCPRGRGRATQAVEGIAPGRVSPDAREGGGDGVQK